jgi:putative membrane protein
VGNSAKDSIMKKYPLLAGVMAIGLSLPAVTVGVASIGHAQNVGSGQTGGSVAFVRDASHTGLFEMQAGRLALERSQHPGVRGYAIQTVKDASEMLNRVKFINESNVSAPLPSRPSDDEQVALNGLAGLNGPEFDREYMRMQIIASDFLALTFRTYGANGESDTLRVYAAKARTIMGSL